MGKVRLLAGLADGLARGGQDVARGALPEVSRGARGLGRRRERLRPPGRHGCPACVLVPGGGAEARPRLHACDRWLDRHGLGRPLPRGAVPEMCPPSTRITRWWSWASWAP